jgi:predicted glycosyltransferase
VPDLPSYLTAAELVVSMAGYNTLAEILAQRCRAIVIPRTWYSGGHSNRERARVDLEQLVRAKALAQLGLVDLLEPMELSPERLAERITAAIAGPQVKPKFPANVRGLECTVNHILAMAKGKEGI